METTNTVAAPKKSKWKKYLLLFILGLILILVSYIYVCGMTYSSGARTGIVIKISEKGTCSKPMKAN